MRKIKTFIDISCFFCAAPGGEVAPRRRLLASLPHARPHPLALCGQGVSSTKKNNKLFVYQGVTFHTFQNQVFFHICTPNIAEK